MTVIAAVRGTDGDVYIASDSRVSAGAAFIDGQSKLYTLGLAIVGVAGALRMHQAVRSMPSNLQERSAAREWVDKLAEHVLSWAHHRGHGRTADGTWVLDLELLVATPGHIFEIRCDGGVVEVRRDWQALGSGGSEARGSLATSVLLQQAHPSIATTLPDERLRLACAVAAELDFTCGGSIVIKRVGP